MFGTLMWMGCGISVLYSLHRMGFSTIQGPWTPTRLSFCWNEYCCATDERIKGDWVKIVGAFQNVII